MSSDDQKMINELEALLTFNNDQEKLELEAELLHLKFIKVVEKLMQQEEKNKADLAEEMNTSKSYITQLFSGDKLFNMKTLAKLQRILNISFKVSAEKKRTEFKSVDCGKFKKVYGVDSIKTGSKVSRYHIDKQDNLTLAV